jgi:hypothetical protein
MKHRAQSDIELTQHGIIYRHCLDCSEWLEREQHYRYKQRTVKDRVSIVWDARCIACLREYDRARKGQREGMVGRPRTHPIPVPEPSACLLAQVWRGVQPSADD